MNVTVLDFAALRPELARALRGLASASCPATFHPKGIVLVGATDVATVLGAGSVSALWTIEAGAVDAFIATPALQLYLSQAIPVIALVERLEDARMVEAALGRAGAA